MSKSKSTIYSTKLAKSNSVNVCMASEPSEVFGKIGGIVGPESESKEQEIPESIKDSWIEMLKGCQKQNMAKKILDKKNRKKIRYSHSVYNCDNSLIVVTNVVGVIDKFLIELANDPDRIGFPRGFAVIWDLKTKSLLTISTFLSKFENDKRNCEEESLESKIDNETVEVKFAKKFSGSLMMLTAFKVNGKVFLYVGAKNSIGNQYTAEFTKLLEEVVKKMSSDQKKNLYNLLTSGHTICFEGCSNNYQIMGQHGALYNTSIPVALVVADTSNPDDIATFWDDRKTVPLFKELNLPIENRYYAVIDKIDEFKKWTTKLYDMRDFLTNDTFNDLVKEGIDSGCIKIDYGNMLHAQLSNTLEGLIIWIFNKNKPKANILKYKFPKYTRMTMCLRTLISQGHIQPGRLSRAVVMREAESWANYWVANEKNRALHISWVLNTATEISKSEGEDLNTLNYLNIAEPTILDVEKSAEIIDPKTWIGPSTNVVLVIGHIGSGKSSVLKKLQEMGYYIVEVDDDNENTPVSKGAKNSRIYQSVVLGLSLGCPVAIANGGGLFYDKKKNLTILNEISKRSPFNIEIAAVLSPFLTTDFNDDRKTSMLKDTRTAVESRFKREIYQMTDDKEIGYFSTKENAQSVFKGVTQRNIESQTGVIEYANSNNVPVVSFSMDYSKTPPVAVIDDDKNVISNIGKEEIKVDVNTIKTTFGLRTAIGNLIGHVTCRYGASISETKEFINVKKPVELIARKIVITEDNTNNSRKYVVYSVEPDSLSNYFTNDRPAHMSVNAPFEAIHNGSVVSSTVGPEPNTPIEMTIKSAKFGTKVWTVIPTDEIVKMKVIGFYAYSV